MDGTPDRGDSPGIGLVHSISDALDHSPQQLTELLGGKGAGLVRMAGLGIPVPPAFIIPTTVHSLRTRDPERWRQEGEPAVGSALARLERETGKRLGDPESPLLVSVRSGAARSMPGMMDTVLNVGMTPAVAEGLAAMTGDRDFARDIAARAATSFEEVVGAPAPADPHSQVLAAVEAVFRSWDSPRATSYREREGIDHDLGTAVTVQAMVFGNLDAESGTGVAFTRDPSTGAPGMAGDVLFRAQGEDVVAGAHRTLPLAELRTRLPGLWDELQAIADRLERELADMADIEFTIESGRLWVLQCRVGKRSPRATFRIAADLAEGADPLIDRAEAVARCAELLDGPPTAPAREPGDDAIELVRGLAASPGRAAGVLSTDLADAVARAERGESVILARRETSPGDVAAIGVSAGIVTALGGLVSHAAVVARGWGLPAVVGAAELQLDELGISAGGRRIENGTPVTVDGDRGVVWLGEFAASGDPLPEVEKIQAWARAAASAPEAGAGIGVSAGARGTRAESDAGSEEVLRLVTLRGMAAIEWLAEALAQSGDDVRAHLAELEGSGLISGGAADHVTPTEAGTERIDAVFRAESQIAIGAVEAELDRFHSVNLGFKRLVTRWQLREVDGEQVPNEHDDPEHDAAVVSQLCDQIHPAISETVAAVADALPRVSGYTQRLSAALERLGEGDHRYLAHPAVDSYHSIWFELHEELIRLAGRDRAGEAEAGRA